MCVHSFAYVDDCHAILEIFESKDISPADDNNANSSLMGSRPTTANSILSSRMSVSPNARSSAVLNNEPIQSKPTLWTVVMFALFIVLHVFSTVLYVRRFLFSKWIRNQTNQ